MRIFELKVEQETVLDALSWCDTEEEIKEELKKLNLIIKGIESKLNFWVPLLKESEGEVELAKQAFKRFEEQHKANIKRKEKRAEWIREHVLSLMVDFGIDKFDDGLFTASHRLAPGSVELCEDFDIEKIPKEFITTIPEQKFIDKKAMAETLRGLIKDDKGKLEVGTVYSSSPSLPGVFLLRKQSLSVR